MERTSASFDVVVRQLACMILKIFKSIASSAIEFFFKTESFLDCIGKYNVHLHYDAIDF